MHNCLGTHTITKFSFKVFTYLVFHSVENFIFYAALRQLA